ncbi:MAG: PAS domain S-box protein [Desulfatiglandales bacterium]
MSIDIKPPDLSKKSPRPQSIRRILTFLLTAAFFPALIALAYIQWKHFASARSRETQWTEGAEGGWEQVIAPLWGDLAIGSGLVLLAAVFSAAVAFRCGRLILRDMHLLRDSMLSWSKSGGEAGQPPMPRITELRETASLAYETAAQRAQMEEALRQSESRWKELAEGLPHLVWTCVPEGACDFLSKRWVAHTGLGEDEHLGYGWLENLHPEDRPVIMERWENAVQTGTLFDAEFRIRRHDGTYRWFKSRAVPVHDDSGKIFKWYGASSDIHNLRELQAALHESSEGFRRVLENIPDGVVIYDQELNIQYVNDAISRISGRPAGDFMGRRDQDIWPLDVCSIYLPTLRESLETRSVRSVEVDVTVESRRFYVHIRFVPMFGADGAVKEIMAVVQDLTKWKQAETALQQKQVALEISKRLTAEKELMLHEEKLRALTAELMVSEEEERRRIAVELHDRIGQNLAISKIKLGMALKAAPSGDVADMIAVTRDLIGQTIEDTRSLSFELSPPALQEADLYHALEELVEYFLSIHGFDIEFSWRGREDVLDKNQAVILYMAVRELLLNVFKHAGTSKASLTVHVSEEQLRITVEDNGRSFPDSSVLLNNGKPKGFGLATMDQRLKSISGTFTIDLSSGGGTRVDITLPIHADHLEEEPS